MQYDPIKKQWECIPLNPPPPICPPGQHYDLATGKCVDDILPDLCEEDPNAEGCTLSPDPCIENPNTEGCPIPPPPPPDPCEEDPTAEGCEGNEGSAEDAMFKYHLQLQNLCHTVTVTAIFNIV